MKTLIYIPALLVLSIFYSRIVVLSPENVTEKIKSNLRAPASVLEEDNSCMRLIASFYPEQSKEMIKSRIDAVENFHSFYRSFVPLFYKVVKDEKKMKKMSDLSKYVSTIGGDVHVENFGFVVDDKKNVVLSLNDFDDTTEGEVYLDVLRHFISSSVVTKDIDWKDYLKAYEKGIKNEKYKYSFNTEKKINSTLEDTEKVLEETIGNVAPVKFQKFKKPKRSLTNEESSLLKKTLNRKYPQIEIYDQYARIKEDGGSAGMLRYELLVRLTPKDKITWIDVKETGVSSYDKVFTDQQKISSFDSRLNHLKENIFDGNINNAVDVIDIGKKEFSLRKMDNFAIGVSLKKIDEADYGDVILDEAYALGRIHSTSLRARSFDPESYVNDWEKISSKDLKEVSNSLRDELEKLYKKSKKEE